MTTRETVLASWRAAQQATFTYGSIVMTAPSFVGYALEVSGGDVAKAMALVPHGPEEFADRVMDTLAIIFGEELPVAATGTDR